MVNQIKRIMKELSIEQKAKRYDEAKYIMKEYLESGNAGVIAENTIKKAFPELKESEDERIRKELLQIAKESEDSFYMVMTPDKRKHLIAWLEKQGNANKEYWRGYREGKQEILYKYAELEKQEQNPQITTSTEAKEALYDKPDNHTYSFEDMYEASKQCYDSKYNKDEYCHEQSFKWGFQEGAEWREWKPAAWSEEDDYNLQCCIAKVQNDIDNGRIGRNRELLTWLKSLRPQNSSITDEELAQAKKDAYNDALDKIEYHNGEPTFDDGWSAAIWYLKKRNVLH